jgi:hypothetical protein
MPMRLLGTWFPDLDRDESRVVTVPEGDAHLPAGDYAFVELYCDEPGCPCDNVMINVLDGDRNHVATLNHSITPGGFADVGEPDTFLDPLNRQSGYSRTLLALFEQVVLSREYGARLRRHRAMVRTRVEAEAPVRPRSAGRGPGAPEPRRTWTFLPTSPKERPGAGSRGGTGLQRREPS